MDLCVFPRAELLFVNLFFQFALFVACFSALVFLYEDRGGLLGGGNSDWSSNVNSVSLFPC